MQPLTDNELSALRGNTVVSDEGVTEAQAAALAQDVRAPEGAGTFTDMFGPALGGNTKAQRDYLNNYIASLERQDPEAFAQKFPAGVTLDSKGQAQRKFLLSQNVVGGLFFDTSELLPGFDMEKYKALNDIPNQTKYFADRRRSLLAEAGKNNEIGERITDMFDDGLSFGQAYKIRQAANDEEVDEILRDSFGREARLLSPVQVGVDAEDNPIYEKLYQKAEGGQVFRLQVYDDFTSARDTFADVFAVARDIAGIQTAPEGARERVDRLLGSVGVATVDAMASPEVLLPALAFALFPGAAAVGLGAQVGMAMLRGSFTGAAQLGGQLIDRGLFANLDSPFDNLDYADALLEGTLGAAGPAVFQAFKQGMSKAGLLFDGAEGPINRAVQKSAAAAAPGVMSDVAQYIGTQTDLPSGALLLKQDFGKLVAKAALKFREDAAEEIRTGLGEKLYEVFQNNISDVKNLSNLNKKDFYFLAASYRDTAKGILRRRFNEGSDGIAAAAAARENLVDLERNMRGTASKLYDAALTAKGSVNFELLGDLQANVNNRLDKMKALALKGLNSKSILTVDEAGNEVVKNIPSLDDRIVRAYELIGSIKNFDTKVKSPVTKEFTGVMDQLHNLKMELNDASLNTKSENVKEIRELIDESLEEVGNSFKSYGTKGRDLYGAASEIYAQLGRIKKQKYIREALEDGDVAPLQRMIQPIQKGESGEYFTEDTIYILNELLKFEPKKFANVAFPGSKAQTIKQAQKEFKGNMARVFEARAVTEGPNKFLRNFFNVEDLSTIDANNDAFKFLVPSATKRKLFLQTALDVDAYEKEAKIFSDAAKQVLVASGKAVDTDIGKVFYDIVKQLSGNTPDGAAAFFEDAIERFASSQTKEGASRIIPQVQGSMLRRLMNTALRVDLRRPTPDSPAEEVEVLDLGKLTEAIKTLRKDPFDRQFADYLLRRNTGLNGINDTTDLLKITEETADLLLRMIPDGGDSIATGGQAQKITDPAANKTALIKKLIVNKTFTDMLLSPVNRQRVQNIINSDKIASRKAISMANLIRQQEERYRSKEENIIAVDGKFYTKDSGRLPQRDEIFQEFERMKNESKLPKVRPGLIQDVVQDVSDLFGEQGDDVLTGSNVTLPTVQSAPIPPARTGLNIPAAPTTGGQGIAGLASPATVQQLAQVGLPLFGGSSGPR